MSLPIFINKDKDFGMMQTAWASSLNPVIEMPINSGEILTKVSLVAGFNQVNHKLTRKLQGWIVIRMRASATIFDTQDANQYPDKNLFLTA